MKRSASPFVCGVYGRVRRWRSASSPQRARQACERQAVVSHHLLDDDSLRAIGIVSPLSRPGSVARQDHGAAGVGAAQVAAGAVRHGELRALHLRGRFAA